MQTMMGYVFAIIMSAITIAGLVWIIIVNVKMAFEKPYDFGAVFKNLIPPPKMKPPKPPKRPK
jgi:hypothetical protein